MTQRVSVKRAKRRAVLAGREKAMRPRLRQGEQLREWCCDSAECECGPVFIKGGLECLWIGEDSANKTQRCLTCGTVWTARRYRWEPARVIARVLVEAA